jgi:hypothetical protein
MAEELLRIAGGYSAHFPYFAKVSDMVFTGGTVVQVTWG